MSALRDRRVRIYRGANVGGAGLVSMKYTFTIERWASVLQRTALDAPATPASGPGAETINGVIDFAPGIDVRYGDLLIDGDDRYFARGVTRQRNPDATIVTAERVTREVYETLNIDLTGTDVGDVTSAGYDTSIVES